MPKQETGLICVKLMVTAAHLDTKLIRLCWRSAGDTELRLRYRQWTWVLMDFSFVDMKVHLRVREEAVSKGGSS